MAVVNYKSTPFDKAIAQLESKIALPSERWNDFSDAEADAVFWTAGATDANLVSDIQKMTAAAIKNGTPYDSPEFAAQIQNFSQQYGWDIKGDADWRARLILTQNLRQDYAAGRYQQQFDPSVQKLQPYLQYIHSDSRVPRPAHIALDGKVFRKDDPIVSSIYPPNGFNCGCSMISLSQRQLDKKGLDVEDISLGDKLPYVDDRGQTKEAVIAPDKGFDHAPGSSSADTRIANLERVKERLPKDWSPRIDNAIANLIAQKMSGGLPALNQADKVLRDQIAQAKADLDRAQAIADLAGKLYGNKHAKLDAAETGILRVAGIDAKAVNYPVLRDAQLALAAAKEQYALLSPQAKDLAPQGGERAKGEPLSTQLATKALNAKESAIAQRKLGFDAKDPSQGALDAQKISQELRKQKIPLSALDVAAIRNYTGVGYVATNGALRGQQQDPNSSFAEGQTVVARTTNQALLKLPKFEGELRRDTRLPSELISSYKEGSLVQFNGITSTTSDLKGEATRTYGNPESLTKAGNYTVAAEREKIDISLGSDLEKVQFQIQAKSGRDISAFSTIKNEREVALPHGWSGTVTKIEVVNGKKIIYLEES